MALNDALKRLVDQARTDPVFFHELVFDPEKVLKSLTYLDRRTKAALMKMDPSAVIRNLLPPDPSECANTCGAGSCTQTCGAGSCIETCGSSCGGTCGNSCDHTSGLMQAYVPDDPQRGGLVVRGGTTPAAGQIAAGKSARTTRARARRKA